MKAPHVAWLAGSGRSGTTWLSGLLAAAPATAEVFEPLHPRRGPLPARLDPPLVAGGRPYLRPGQDAPEWRSWVARVGGGTAANRWTRFGHNRRTRWPALWWKGLGAETRLVKEIRANLMIGWLAASGVRSAVVLRHPCATVLSQEEGRWGSDLTPLLSDRSLVADWLAPHAGWLARLGSERERLAARWAIESLVPLRQAESGVPITVVHYEDVVADPAAAATRLAQALGIPLAPAALERAVARRVSVRPTASGTDPIARWRKALDAADVRRILDVCSRLGVDCYDDGPLPVNRSTAAAS